MQPGQQSQYFGVKVSKPGVNVNNASDQQLVYKDNFSTKTFYDDSNSRMLEGLLPDGTYGIWVSAPGVDVTTADPTNPGDLVFNSGQQILRVDNIIEASQSVNSIGPIGATYAHGLSYAPGFLAYTNSNDPADHGITFSATGSGVSVDADSFGYVYGSDTTNVYVTWIGNSATTYIANIKIYLFQQSIAF